MYRRMADKAVVVWANNRTGIVCVRDDSGETRLVHRKDLMTDDRKAKRSVIRGETVCELKAQEWVCIERDIPHSQW